MNCKMPENNVLEPEVVTWTLEAYMLHNESMRTMETKILEERDRRYMEVNVEKEKALKIKETADLAALSLARESQLYKDQQADVMRDKNLASSGIYATNEDLKDMVDKIEKSLKPVFEFVSSQQGISQNSELTMGKMFGIIGAIGVVVGVIVKFM